MKRVNSILCASLLMVVLASTTLAGNISLKPGNISLKPEDTKSDAITVVVDIVTSILGNISL